jgi:hypothetical protein
MIMGILREGDETTLRQVESLIGNKMRVISHVTGTLVVDIGEDIFYLIVNTGKRDQENRGIYRVALVGDWERLLNLLKNGKLQ